MSIEDVVIEKEKALDIEHRPMLIPQQRQKRNAENGSWRLVPE